MDVARRQEAADRLLAAYASREPIDPLVQTYPDIAVEDSYDIQLRQIQARLDAGAVVRGHKVGLTSAAMQRQLGVDQPDSGVLFDDMRVAHRACVGMDGLLQPRVEAEIAFILSADLDDDLSERAIRLAAGVAVPAIEIVDSRVRDWSISIVDTVADNGSSALFVLGEPAVPAADIDFVSRTMSMTEDGATVSQGRGADCLGSPLLALQWLARTARDNGSPLRAGHIVLSGALGPMVAVRPGSNYVATIDGIGSAEVSFA